MDVPPFGHQVAVRGGGRNVDDIACGHTIPHSPLNAIAPTTPSVDHFAAHKQGRFAAPYEHDVLDVIMYLGVSIHSVRLSTNKSEAVRCPAAAEVGESLAGRAVRAHTGGEGRVPPFQLRSLPHVESRRDALNYRRVGKDNGSHQDMKWHDHRELPVRF